MTFQTFHFLVFFLAVFALNRALVPFATQRKLMLVVANYYFYMCWDIRFCAVLAGITLVNHLAASKMAATSDPRSRKVWLLCALGCSLGVLGYFKYANFLLDSTYALAQSLQLPVNEPMLRVVQPVGLSFFTFQALSYTLDIYRKQQPTRSLLDYALFVSFFPTLLSGPITRARDFLGQLSQVENRALRNTQASEGLILILRGLVKKILIADLLALHLVNPAFSDPASYSSAFLLVAVYGYTMQIYMDLSGYTDIARGVAKMLGFELPKNFDRPYLSPTISSFWQRWHISMSSFFRDYLFFSLGGSRYGNVYRNLMITFVAIGAWHGAGWNFILYGALHGGLVCLERWRRDRYGEVQHRNLAQWVLAIAFTFHFVVLTRVLFRADDLGAAVHYVQALLVGHGTAAPWAPAAVATLVLSFALHLVPARMSTAVIQRLAKLTPPVQGALALSVIFGLSAFAIVDAPFIYFDF